MTEPLWRPTPEGVANSNMTAFMREIESRHGVSLPDFDALHRFSLERMEDFWGTEITPLNRRLPLLLSIASNRMLGFFCLART